MYSLSTSHTMTFNQAKRCQSNGRLINPTNVNFFDQLTQARTQTHLFQIKQSTHSLSHNKILHIYLHWNVKLCKNGRNATLEYTFILCFSKHIEWKGKKWSENLSN